MGKQRLLAARRKCKNLLIRTMLENKLLSRMEEKRDGPEVRQFAPQPSYATNPIGPAKTPNDVFIKLYVNKFQSTPFMLEWHVSPRRIFT